jgi:hypothetical protein
MAEEEKRRVGRPRTRSETGPGDYVGFRAPRELKEKLETAAANSGRSLSTEAQFRLEQSFGDSAYSEEIAALAELLARAMTETGISITGMNQVAGHGSRSWLTDPYAYDQAVQSAIHVLEMSRPSGSREPWGLCASADFPRAVDMGKAVADGILETMRGRHDLPGTLAKQWTPRVRDKLGVIGERLLDQPEPDDYWAASRTVGGKPVEVDE